MKRNANDDIRMLERCACHIEFSKFAAIALPHWIERALLAEIRIMELEGELGRGESE